MAIEKFDATRFEQGAGKPVVDRLTVEAMLEIRVNGRPFTMTMRTPGEDQLLARGLLHTEQIVTNRDAKISWREETCGTNDIPRAIDAAVAESDLVGDFDGKRSLASTSSCGLCGKRDAESAAVVGDPLPIVQGEVLYIQNVAGMLDAMRAGQDTFESSGGSHAAAVYSIDGKMLALHEDIGRHNAVDKCVGWMIESGDRQTRCLLVSGRMSFEIIAKAYRAEIPIVLSVSAPSSLAVHMGERLGLTVIGFCRENRATVYTGNARVR